jgi:hypothetical protein
LRSLIAAAALLFAALTPALAQQVPNPMPITGGPQVAPRFGYLQVQRPTTAATDLADMYVYRDANYVGGTHGTVNTLAAFNTTIRAGALPHEWNLYAAIDNYATYTDNSENVALYAAGVKRAGAKTWGAVSQVTDYNTTAPTQGSIGLEINHTSGGPDVGNNRIALEIYNNVRPGGVSPANMRSDISFDGAYSSRLYGLEFNGTGLNYWNKLLGITGAANYGYGIDLSGGVCGQANFTSAGFLVACNGAVVLGVATPQAAGTINVQTGYYAGDTPGVTCAAGVTAATVRVKNGIVTAC